ncbi:MAG: hypothetical protein F4147_09540 [Gammaproteobacteria bacterium]|nr:hypothetical protein [Gammaproteobacteria bacterium]
MADLATAPTARDTTVLGRSSLLLSRKWKPPSAPPPKARNPMRAWTRPTMPLGRAMGYPVSSAK